MAKGPASVKYGAKSFISLTFFVLLLLSFSKANSFARFEGFAQTYWRVRTDVPAYISWNEETFGFTYGSTFSKTSFVADGEFSFLGKSESQSLEELSRLERIDPFRWRLNDLFALIDDFPYRGAYLKAGRQIRKWGTADAFNPTDNLNPYSLEDPIMFGESLGNEMIVLSLPVKELLTIELVCIPLFRPAQIPESAVLALTEDSPSMPEPIKKWQKEMESKGDLKILVDLLGLKEYSMGDINTSVIFPSRSIKNLQAAIKLSTTILGVDLSVSYLYGYEDMPYPGNISTAIVQKGDKLIITPSADIRFPRVHVVGGDLSTSLEFLDGAGLWIEGAVFFPESYTVTGSFAVSVSNPTAQATISALLQPEEIKLLTERYWKLTAGMDYTTPGGFYINIQYLHGFFDEIGNDAVKNYIFAVLEKNLFSDRLKLRFTAGVTLDDFSTVFLPELYYYIQDTFEIHAGSYILQGGKDTKFGQPAAGGDEAFLSFKYRF